MDQKVDGLKDSLRSEMQEGFAQVNHGIVRLDHKFRRWPCRFNRDVGKHELSVGSNSPR